MTDSHAPTVAIAALPQAVVECTGADAVSFLHGQLSNDMAALEAGHSALAAYCSPKGRVLGLLRVWRTPDGLRFLTDAALAPALVKRLTMFVLRARVKLAALGDHTVAGVLGMDAPVALARAGLPCPAPDTEAASDGVSVLGVPGATPRCLLAGPGEAVARAIAATGLPAAPAEAWTLADIHAGLAQVTTGTQELFVPQHLNLELTGAINFRKGCYPGQEIVARMHYRGRPTRRMVGLALEDGTPPLPGEALFGADPDQAAGEVVCAAPSGAGAKLLAVVQLSALGAPLHLHAPDRPALHRLDLPYAVPELDGPA